MGTELEFKYRLQDEAQMEAVLGWPMLAVLRVGEPYRIDMETTYFDTASGDFSARHWTLRRRTENGRAVYCVKTPLGGAASGKLRGEWEVEAGSWAEALPNLVEAGAPEALAAVSPEAFVPLCDARFTRQAQLLRLSKATSCELACDLGVLRGGEKEAPLCELELELKEGDEKELYAFSQMLAVCFRLKQEPRSKYARARKLAGLS